MTTPPGPPASDPLPAPLAPEAPPRQRRAWTILGRLSQAVREQNWFAVALEVCIVVLGIVIGLQLNNWNAGRLDDQREVALLSNMREDLRDDIAVLEGRIETLAQAEDYGHDLLDQLAQETPCTDGCWPLLVRAFHASQWFDLSPDRSTFEELRRNEMPRNDDLKRAIATYYTRSERIDLANEIPRYRELARSLIPALAQQHLWTSCYRIEGNAEVLIEDCPPALAPDESRAVAEALRRHPETVPSLTYRISTTTLLKKALQSQIEDSETVIGLIGREIGRD